MTHTQKNSAGILALNLIDYMGEYANIVEGTQYLIPFSGKNRGTVEGIAELFIDKHTDGTEERLVNAKILDASSVQEAVYGCKVADALNYSDVNIVPFDYAFDAALLKRLREVIDSATSFDLRKKLNSSFDLNMCK